MMSAARATLLYCLAIGLLWALVPSVLFPNPPLDVVEGFAWGRDLALGYTKHPPLQAWLLEGSYHLTGGHAFGAYWLSQICYALTYLAIWLLGRDMGLAPGQRFWAIAATSCAFYFTLPAPEFNPNILQIPVWAGMLLFFHRGLSRGRLADWLLLGLTAALGLYAKYFTGLLIGCIGLYALTFRDARRCLATPGPYLAMVLALALFVPHVWWLKETDFLTFTYAASRSVPAEGIADHILNPVNFLLGQFGSMAPVLIPIFAGLGLAGLRGTAPEGEPPRGSSADLRFLLWFTLLPALVVMLVSGMTGNAFKQMWGASMFTLAGLLLVRFASARNGNWSIRRALAAAAAVQVIFLSVAAGQALVEPLIKKKPTRIHFPGAEVAAQAEAAWREATGTPLTYVAGDMWPAAHVTLFSADRPHLFTDHIPAIAPWISMEDVKKTGVLVIWTGDSETPTGSLAALYPGRLRDGFADIPYAAPAKWPPLRLNWLIVRPGEVAGG
ncbi:MULTISPECIES: glycosyltransferase family 39 protein [unclassified Pannonibacter]|uniref:glycosyltransferase family 39 protein n=2 Tax=Pannonibacter TaxID=227873 RepID=UPI001646B002|nr:MULTISPECIES: glycosyltransferase family 39 protein [unclassified Pannonibacter]